MAKEQAKKNNELAKQNTDIDRPLPAFMQGKVGMGMERIDASDVEIPRIKLLQALSPEVAEGGKRQGTFLHTVTEEELGNELKVVIVYYDRSFILWRPRGSGGGILARAMDGIHWTPANSEFEVTLDKKDGGNQVKWKTMDTVAKSGLAEWGSMNPSDPKSPPAATRMFNYVVVSPDHPEMGPAVVTLQRAGIRVGRKLNSKLMAANAPLFGLRFIMSSFRDASPQGEFWNYRFTSDGMVESEKDFNSYEALYNQFKKLGLKIRDEAGLQTDDTPEGETAGKGTTQGDKY